MSEGDRSRFVRSVGNVVLDSLHPASFLTGIILGSPMLLGALVASKTPNPLFSSICALASIPLTMYVQSRLAMNAFAGDSKGGLFAQSGGTIVEVLPVFARLFALSVLWSLPFAVIVWKWEANLRGLSRFPLPGIEPPATIVILYLGATLIVPFFLLTAAVAATAFAEIFASGLWSGLFGGRLGEVILMIAATLGAPAAIVVVLAPWGAALAFKVPDLAGFLASMAAIYLAGVTLSIQARLCGSFANSVMLGETEETVPAKNAPSASGAQPGAPSGASSGPIPAPPASPAVDAEIRQAWAAFPSDQESALARLADLAAAPVPDARVLHALAMMKHQAGDSAGAIEAARQAIPLCLKANEGQLATELYRLHAADARSLFLDAAQLVALGDLLIAQNDPSAAANAWAHALTADAGNRKAFKGLLKIADQILQTGAALDRAIRIYDFLIQRAPDSPFADHARTQLEIARRKAAKG